jgi:hypothetical protein
MMSPRMHPAPQWLTPIAVVTHFGWSGGELRPCSSSQRGLVRLAYRQYTQTASGPKYNAVIVHTASMTRIGCR